MKLSDFDFHLPEDRIALHPASPRDSSRLLLVAPDATPELSDHVFSDLPALLAPGDLLVFNDTRVIPARLLGHRIRDDNRQAIEALLIKRRDDATWEAFAKPGKRLKLGDTLRFGGQNPACDADALSGTIIEKREDGIVAIRFERAGAFLDEAIALVGGMPLPPYILDARRRAGEGAAKSGEVGPGSREDFASMEKNRAADIRDYQTIFAARDGAVAAPTASLHFTPDLVARLGARGVQHVFVTLHVGAGTFLPVKSENLDEHRMHAEWGEVSAAAAARIRETRANGGRIIAVGTTACRLIESAAHSGDIAPFVGETDIFIRPGYRFRVTDALITNFHLPKSTLLMLVSAFAGIETMRRAYAHAIAGGYRFYSYGDGSLLWRSAP